MSFLRTLGKVTGIVFFSMVGVVLGLWLLINVWPWPKMTEPAARLIERLTAWNVRAFESFDLSIGRRLYVELDGLLLESKDEQEALEVIDIGHFAMSLDVLAKLFHDRWLIETLVMRDSRIVIDEAGLQEETNHVQDANVILQKVSRTFLRSALVEGIEGQLRRFPEGDLMPFTLRRFVASSKDVQTSVVIAGEGRWLDVPFDFQGSLAARQLLEQMNPELPLDISARFGPAILQARGWVKPDTQDIELRAHLRLTSWRDLPGALDLPPLELSQVFVYQPSHMAMKELDLKFGRSTMQGGVELDVKEKKSRIVARLRAPRLYQEDLLALRTTASQLAESVHKHRVFSREPLDWKWLQEMQGDLSFELDEYRGEVWGPILDRARVQAKLVDGQLTIEPMDIKLADGRLQGSLRLDQDKQLSLVTDLRLNRVDMARLLTPLAFKMSGFDIKPAELIKGRMSGVIQLAARGSSPHGLASSLDGQIRLAVDEGTIAATLIEAFGFDLTGAFMSWFTDHPAIEIQCAIFSLPLAEGRISTDLMLVATADSNIVGSGWVDLGKEQIDYRLEARAKDFSIGAAKSPIFVRGSLARPEIQVGKGGLAARMIGAVALGLVNPLLAVLPFVEPGLEKNGACKNYMDRVRKMRDEAKAEPELGKQSVTR